MTMIQKILVPIDFSDASKEAAEQAMELCKAFNAELRLVHVRDLSGLVIYGEDSLWPGRNLEQKTNDTARKEMDKYIQELKAPVKVTSVVVSTNRSVPQMICDEADDSGADWIVMSTHGRTGIDRFVMGSVAERVVRNALCPVLTVRWHKFQVHNAEKEAA